MARIPTKNESTALSYMMLFMQARLALGKNNVQLSWILDNNPLLKHASASEKSDVRTGINALVAHKLLIQDEQGLWLSNLGQIFVEYISGTNQSPAELEESVQNNPDLMEIFGQISADSRFNPSNNLSGTNATQSASNNQPAIKSQIKSHSAAQSPGFWNFWTVLMLIMVCLGFYQIIKAAIR